MRLVVDSNVLLSAILSEGPPSEIVNGCLAGALTLVFCRETFGEVADVLMSRPPFDRLAREVRAAYLGHLAEGAEWRRAAPQPIKCRDPQDQVFLDLAVTAEVDTLVTGDRDLLVLREVGRTRIRSPTEFVNEWRSGQSVRP